MRGRRCRERLEGSAVRAGPLLRFLSRCIIFYHCYPGPKYQSCIIVEALLSPSPLFHSAPASSHRSTDRQTMRKVHVLESSGSTQVIPAEACAQSASSPQSDRSWLVDNSSTIIHSSPLQPTLVGKRSYARYRGSIVRMIYSFL